MKERGSIPISVANNSTFSESGSLFTVVVKNKEPKKATNDTAIHEAQHVIAAEVNGTAVVSATIVRSGDAIGSTHLSRPDSVAAMAPHSVGSSGTSWDVFITKSMGANPDAAASVGRTIVTQNSHMVNSVAVALEDRMIIYRGDVRRAMSEAEIDRKNGPAKEITVFIKSADGSQKTLTENSFRGEVLTLGRWVNIDTGEGAKDEESI